MYIFCEGCIAMWKVRACVSMYFNYLNLSVSYGMCIVTQFVAKERMHVMR